MERKTTLDDLVEARSRIDPVAVGREPTVRAASLSTGGPGVAAWVGALLYAVFGLLSGALLGPLWAPFGVACVCGGALVPFSLLFVRDHQRIVAGMLLIAGGLLVGTSWGFLFAAFGAETDTQLAVATVIGAVFFGWPPMLAGSIVLGRGARARARKH